MLIDKIINMIKQMSLPEQKDIYYICKGLGLKVEHEPLRHDIKCKIMDMIQKEFPWVNYIKEDSDLSKMGLDSVNIVDFSETLIKEFGLEDIEFAKIMEWNTVEDIVSTVFGILQGWDEVEDIAKTIPSKEES